MTPNAMIFAAGRGTRMAPLTDRMPKPLIEVDGRPLIDHALGLLADHPPAKIVINTQYRAAQIKAHLAGTPVIWSDEATRLETGGGLKHALPLLGPDPVLTLNTDAVYAGPNPVSDLITAWRPTEMDALLHLVRVEHAVGHSRDGDFSVDPAGRLTRGKGFVYTGTQIISTPRVAAHPEAVFSLNTIWDQMIVAGRLFGLVTDVTWCDVGQPASIALAEHMLENAHVS